MFDFLSTNCIIISVAIALYYIYWKYCSFYKIYDPAPEGIRNKLRRGKCPPSYPNGWYRLGRSDELVQGEVHEAKFAGRHIVYYRGHDGIAYALHAYCAHMGANLGFGGKVKNVRCIECPFHGWRFDGRDGRLVQGDTYESQKVTVCEYHDINSMSKEENYLNCGKEQEVKIKSYITREKNNVVYVWLHAKAVQPLYEPFEDMLGHFVRRGESINYVNCHIQEIPENGADMRHFEYLHYSIVNFLDPIIKFRWSMKTKNASDPDFYEEMKHPNKKVREYQMKLFNRYLESNKERKKVLNVLSLDAEIILFNKYPIYFLTTTGFQTGPATVSLYLRSIIFEAVYQQAIQPIDKFTQRVIHTLYMNPITPYWLSMYAIYGELRQVIFDTLVWNSKIFSDKICYNLKSPADKALYNWRNWYAQFYEGAHEFEQGLDKLEW